MPHQPWQTQLSTTFLHALASLNLLLFPNYATSFFLLYHFMLTMPFALDTPFFYSSIFLPCQMLLICSGVPSGKFKHHLANLPIPDLSPTPNKYISETAQTKNYGLLFWLQWYQDFLIFLIFLCFSLLCNCHLYYRVLTFPSFFHCLCFPNHKTNYGLNQKL